MGPYSSVSIFDEVGPRIKRMAILKTKAVESKFRSYEEDLESLFLRIPTCLCPNNDAGQEFQASRCFAEA